jgi:hypothetical protein
MQPAVRALLVALLLVAAAVATAYLFFAPAINSPAAAGRATPLPGPADAPVVEITADHQLARLQHKAKNGLSPLEIVATPDGPITIQRTFKTTGELLKEEAFLDGKPVPMPKPLPAGTQPTPEKGP